MAAAREPPSPPTRWLRRVGVVVHPTRDIGEPLGALRSWAEASSAEIVQVPVAGLQREVAELGDADRCDLIIAIGGDGTTLGAIHAAATADRPVLGVACGSLGVLTTVPADALGRALERFSAGQWMAAQVPALSLEPQPASRSYAFNDVAVVRAGEGQVRTAAYVDGTLYCRFAGDGCVVSTPVGSSAYALAAGGPLLMPGIEGFMLTALPTHGGFCPPLVLASDRQLLLEVTAGHGGARLEIDGQIAGAGGGSVTITFRPDVATLVTFSDQESLLRGLRRRRIIMDSPRILADDERG